MSQRMSEMSLYKTNRWKKLSEQIRREHPLCFFSLVDGYTRPCDVVDHIIPIESGGAPFDLRNLQALSHSMHNIKTRYNEKYTIMNGIETRDGLIPSFYPGGGGSKSTQKAITTPYGQFLRTHDDFPPKTKIQIHIIGNISSGKSTAGKFLSEKLNIPHFSIDDYRKIFNDSESLSGEYIAWDYLYRDSVNAKSFVLETSGTAIKLNRFSKFQFYTILIQSKKTIERIENRISIPLPKSYGSVYTAMYFINENLKKTKPDIIVDNDDTIEDFKNKLWQKVESKYQIR